MVKMTSRERVLTALNHEEVDRVPVDLGSTVNSSIVYEGYLNLCKYLNVSNGEPDLIDKMMRVVKVDEEIHRALETDLRGIFVGRHSAVEEISSNQYIDEWGIRREKKPGIYYFEQVEFPLSGDITTADILNYKMPDPNDPCIVSNLKEQYENNLKAGDYAQVITVPSCCIHKSQYLRGFTDWFLDAAANHKLFELLLDAVFEVNYQATKNILEQIGDKVDIVMCSDDLGTQRNMQVSPDFFRKIIKPRFKKYFEMIHNYAPGSKLAFHTCGSVRQIIGDLIEIGVDILNPVQVTASNMDSAELKAEFGDDIAFWGGIDTQSVMIGNSLEAVRNEVEKRIVDLGNGGGFILGAVHNIQPDVPPQNIIELFQHSRKFGIYKRGG